MPPPRRSCARRVWDHPRRGPEMHLPDLPMVGFKGLPCWACSKCLDACCHVRPYSFLRKSPIRTQSLGFRLSAISFRSWRFFLPKPKPSQERIGVVARPATGRQLFQFLHVTSPQDHIVGFEGGDQEGYYVRHIFAPLFLAVLI